MSRVNHPATPTTVVHEIATATSANATVTARTTMLVGFSGRTMGRPQRGHSLIPLSSGAAQLAQTALASDFIVPSA